MKLKKLLAVLLLAGLTAHAQNELRVPAFTAYLEPLNGPARISTAGGVSGWVKGGELAARQASSNAPTFAHKVPVVTGAVDATRNRVNAVAQSVTNSSLGF